jgi:hypothetical protein
MLKHILWFRRDYRTSEASPKEQSARSCWRAWTGVQVPFGRTYQPARSTYHAYQCPIWHTVETPTEKAWRPLFLQHSLTYVSYSMCPGGTRNISVLNYNGGVEMYGGMFSCCETMSMFLSVMLDSCFSLFSPVLFPMVFPLIFPSVLRRITRCFLPLLLSVLARICRQVGKE